MARRGARTLEKRSDLKFVASTNDDTLSESEDPLRPIAYVDIGSVDSTVGITETEEMVFEDAPSRARRLVRDGDTIVSTVRTYLRAIAPVAAPPAEMVVSTGFAVIRPRALDPSFASWALREQGIVDEMVARSTGVSYPAINASQIGGLPIPLPPLDEQHAIAAHLDRETERIDALVAKKRLLIERLDEYRTALITCTVTRGLPPDYACAAGLDPSPRLKPSGVEWLGEVPEHWDVRPLKRIAPSVGVGVVVNPSTYVSEEGVPFLLGRNVAEFSIDGVGAYRLPPEISDGVLAKSRLSEGDLVVVRVGGPGVTAVVTKELHGANCASMMLIRRGSGFVSEWLAYGFNSRIGRCQIDQVQYGAAQKAFNVGHAVDFVFPIPPVDEQQELVRYLEDARERLDRLQSRVETAIERLREYRTALITAAVTGKIDVRE